MMRDRAADRFSEMFARLEIVDWKRFCTAPREARRLSMEPKAPSTTAMATLAPDCEPILMLPTALRVLELVAAVNSVPAALVVTEYDCEALKLTVPPTRLLSLAASVRVCAAPPA